MAFIKSIPRPGGNYGNVPPGITQQYRCYIDTLVSWFYTLLLAKARSS